MNEGKATQWKNIFASKTSLQINERKGDNLTEKWTNDLNRHFTTEDIQRVNKDIKKCSTLFTQGNAN